MSEPITDANELGRIAFDAWGPGMAWEAQTPWLRRRYITMAAAVHNAVCPPGPIVRRHPELGLTDGELAALREIVVDWIAEGFSAGHFPADFLGAFRAIGLTGAEVGVPDEDLAAGRCPCRPCAEEAAGEGEAR